MASASPALPDISGLEALTPAQIYDYLITRLGFDPRRPGWTPALAALHDHSRERRLQLLPEDFYTPVLDPAAMPESVWNGGYDAGVRWDAEEQLAFWEKVHRFGGELAEFHEQFPAQGPARFCWQNTEFQHHDAILYYSLLRHAKPARVVEVGGGFSTLLSSAAAERHEGTRVVCVEPFPRPFLAGGLPGVTLIPEPVQETPLSVFDALDEGDVLFYDGSHISKTGSDVPHVLLRILPRLRPGVWVHVHDIFLPFEYPREWMMNRLYWNEQYVLAALLSHSRKFEVVAGNYFLQRVAPERLLRLQVPGRAPTVGGTSLWMRTLC